MKLTLNDYLILTIIILIISLVIVFIFIYKFTEITNTINTVCNHKSELFNNTESETKKDNICNNKSLEEQNTDAYKYYMKNKIPPNTYPICGSDILNSDTEDILKFYRENTYFMKSYLEDPVVRGNNLTDYLNTVQPDKIGGKININYDKQPKPSNYIFDYDNLF